MQIHGLNKTTLLDYPGHVAATLFLGRCNFRCPFCHNGDLVLAPETQPVIEKEEILAFLKKRKGILTGVCISGGEPTLEPKLTELIKEIKEIGYLVKLDTNGYRTDILRDLTESRLIDYIAMDIKNAMPRYAETVGQINIETSRIQESIYLVMNCGIPYEFRTTVVKELHTREDMAAIGKEIQGAQAYYLQQYKESEAVIRQGFHAYGKEEMEEFSELLRPLIPSVQLRGTD